MTDAGRKWSGNTRSLSKSMAFDLGRAMQTNVLSCRIAPLVLPYSPT